MCRWLTGLWTCRRVTRTFQHKIFKLEKMLFVRVSAFFLTGTTNKIVIRVKHIKAYWLCFMPWQKVTLTTRLMTRYKKKNGGTVHCDRCPTDLTENQECWSHTSPTGTLRLYCLSCFSDLWV